MQAKAQRAEEALARERSDWAAARVALLEDASGTAADRDRWAAEARLASKAVDDAQKELRNARVARDSAEAMAAAARQALSAADARAAALEQQLAAGAARLRSVDASDSRTREGVAAALEEAARWRTAAGDLQVRQGGRSGTLPCPTPPTPPPCVAAAPPRVGVVRGSRVCLAGRLLTSRPR